MHVSGICISNFIEELLNGVFNVIASSRDEDIDKSMKMQRYMRLLLVGFFFDLSNKMSSPSTKNSWKSVRWVKSSNTCYEEKKVNEGG